MAEFEYVIIGSGVAAATIARQLLAKNPNISLAIVEAGSHVPLKDRRRWWDMVSTGKNPYLEFHDLPIGQENQSIGKEPWSFDESRLMGRGGSTVHWGGWALRFKEEDFETCARTGRGADWPIRYSDLETFYGQAEELLGVSGSACDSLGNVLPYRSSDYPLDAFPFVAADRPIIKAFEDLGYTYGHMPIARFRKCMTTGTCRYCPFGARFTAAYLLDEIERNPIHVGFRLFSQSPCQQFQVAAKNRVASVRVKCLKDGRDQDIKGQHFVLAAGSYESPKLLLKSSSKEWPSGIGNDYDQVGRNLVSHPFLHIRAKLPTNFNRWNQELDFPTFMSRHFDSPEQQQFGKLFLFKDRSRPSLNIAEKMIEGKSRREIHKLSQGAMEFELQGFMEEFSVPRNRVLVGDGVNRFGLTQTTIDFERESDFADRVASRLAIMEKIVATMGATIEKKGVRPQRGDHAAATCRMGSSPASSVVDENLRVHGVDNLWVCSNAVFPTGAAVNPTLTLTALSLRLAKHLLDNGVKS